MLNAECDADWLVECSFVAHLTNLQCCMRMVKGADLPLEALQVVRACRMGRSWAYVSQRLEVNAQTLQLSTLDDSHGILLTCVYFLAVCCRAGADLILTYYSVEAAKWLAAEK
jgi:delta-aminolevulinic acid dehydratase/porphobilinogen synthase